jgi:hypothetical protein
MLSPLCSAAPADAATSKLRSQQCGVGAEAALLLKPQPYANLVIEIATTAGATPRQAAIDHLKQMIQDLTGKGATVVMDAPLPAPGHALSVGDVVALENASRTRFALADTGVFFYLVVAESSTSDSGNLKVLGQAYRASSMVIFQKSIDSISGGLGQPSRDIVESSVVAHEFGHVLGLVNIGTPMVQPHEDGAHPAHDTNQSCLMYWLNDSSMLVQNLLTGGVVPDLDAQCRADLLAVKMAP